MFQRELFFFYSVLHLDIAIVLVNHETIRTKFAISLYYDL